jgi:hypothetical protein
MRSIAIKLSFLLVGYALGIPTGSEIREQATKLGICQTELPERIEGSIPR